MCPTEQNEHWEVCRIAIFCAQELTMKNFRLVVVSLCGALAAALLFAAAPAEAHGYYGPRSGVYFQFGVPLWPGYWGPHYYYDYPPPAAYYPPAPPVYVEREEPAQQPVWWYWCPSAKGYYPYVKECPGGWQRVAPQPTN